MARAVRLAERGLHTTDPNPRVGSVLVRDNDIVGEGWHVRAGEPHAEINALRSAGERSRGATAFVTLEPCCHHGRTPPCTAALIEAGVDRVVMAMEDPDPRVRGRGEAALQQAGIKVEVGLQRAEAEALNAGFVRRMKLGRPYVRCKVAASFDGRTALASGESQWITGAEAREDAHQLRARSSAVLTGIGTILADDPSLNARLDTPAVQPLRIVLDTHLRMPPAAKTLRVEGDVVVFAGSDEPTRRAALEEAGARVEIIAAGPHGVDLGAVLSRLVQLEVNELLVEAGNRVSGAFLEAGLIDELVIYFAPHIMGHEGLPMFNLPGLESMSERHALAAVDMRRVGADWRLVAQPVT